MFNVIDYSWMIKNSPFFTGIKYLEGLHGLRWDETNVNHRILSAPPVYQDIKYNKERKEDKPIDPTIIRHRCGCVRSAITNESIHTCEKHWNQKTGR